MATETQDSHPYYVPHPSAYPVVLNAGLFFLSLGFVLKINALAVGTGFMLTGALLATCGTVAWLGKVIRENESGKYHQWEDRSFHIGMGYFIAAELLFFAAFLAALMYTRVFSLPWLHATDLLWPGFEGKWPSSGPAGKPFTPLNAWGVPAANTLLLLFSAASLAWSRAGLLKYNRSQMASGLLLTLVLGAAFLVQQFVEYGHAASELGVMIGTGSYGTMFYMLTGFHGFHLLIGLIMLLVVLFRGFRGHFKPGAYFGFEAVEWYWNFVVVAPGLLVFIYFYFL